MNAFKRLYVNVKYYGVKKTVKKLCLLFSKRGRLVRDKRAELLRLPTSADRFTSIYQNRLWSGLDDSIPVSGTGSTLKYTRNLRLALDTIFVKYKITTVLDAPCGDFTWMKSVMDKHESITYTGGDIVTALIERNNSLFATERIRFLVLDITRETLPAADLMIVRDCLFHLSFSDVRGFIENLLQSDVRYILTTNVVDDDDFLNEDIETGDAHPINIFLPPFNFPRKILEDIDDYVHPFPARKMYLLAVDDVRKHIHEQQCKFGVSGNSG